ncbi:SMI1/KNR4 family protein [Nonomuraea africana]|uniref:Cell wall assembly regulator SMI1 n=1 Tax=Nonomuraea africana TaxID=46171 RepID=A0ABR9KJN2_9ACTN|nr:SMI1/KNR4 family protein [Nonomuraea africana]MBE1561838.1 cell wall assembly regulator SMI1 [Nonomuraea africana]
MSDDRESQITDVLRTMAEKIAAGAPATWRRAEVRGFATGPDGSGHRGFAFEPRDVDQDGATDIDLHPELSALYPLSGATGGHLTIELTVTARGRFEAVISESLERMDHDEHGFLYVLDRDALPPEPAEFQQSPADATPAGDPREAVALLGAYLRERDRILGGPGSDKYALPPAIPEARRTWLEAQLRGRYGAALPDDLRALYALVDGDGGEGLLDRHPWFGLELLESQCRPENRWWALDRSWRRHLLRPLITTVGPESALRRVSDHPRWIPFATSTGGDFLAVDMAPGPGGRPGQVIRMGLHHDDGPVYVADSVTSLLRRHVAALEAGAYRVEHGELWIDLGDMAEPNRDVYEESRSLTVAGPDAATIRGMHARIQRLKVRNAPWVDFGPVRGAPVLWQVAVENCPGADLTPLHDAPVELLDLAMDAIDLAPLKGHPTLRLLTLRTERPVDLTPLLSCPRLYGLDLSGAAVRDIGMISELKGLLYLRLRHGQWEELWQQADHPAGLAAAGLAGEPPREKTWWWSADRAYRAPEPSRATAVGWAADLAGGTGSVRVFTGRFARRRR